MAAERATGAAKPSIAPPPVIPARKPGPSVLTGVVVAVVVICALYFGREVLIPITLAVLLSFVLSPLMELLRRLWLPRAIAALLAVLIAIGVIITLGGIIGTQIAGLAGQVPQYQTTIENKIGMLRQLIGTDLSSRLSGLTHRIERVGLPQQTAPTPPTHGQGAEGTLAQSNGGKPVPVVITETPASSALQLGQRILTPIISPIADLGIILVVAIFTLLQKADLRDRLIRLFGSGDLHRTTAAMDDAGQRLTRYFLTQLGINCSFGLIVGIGLSVIDVPSPVLWGVLGALLRFVPYIGSYIAAALPILLAAAVGSGWGMALWTALLYVVTEMIMGQAVEPLVYGHSTGLSPFSVIIAAIFWTWIWGPIGLILSTPLTLCLVVLGRHIEQLEFLDVMLGDRPPLSQTENFYQRLLAGNTDEADAEAERFLAGYSLSAYYDEVALPGLQLAAADANKGVLTPPQIERIKQVIDELVRDLAADQDVEPAHGEHDDDIISSSTRQQPTPSPATLDGDAVAENPLLPERQAETPVLCIAGRGPLDEAASAMLAQLLTKHAIGARILPHEAVSRARIADLDVQGVATVCISYLDITGSPSHLHFLVRRVRQQLPEASILVGFWPADDLFLRDQATRRAIGADYYVSSLREALDDCRAASRRSAEEATRRPPRLEVVQRTEQKPQ